MILFTHIFRWAWLLSKVKMKKDISKSNKNMYFSVFSMLQQLLCKSRFCCKVFLPCLSLFWNVCIAMNTTWTYVTWIMFFIQTREQHWSLFNLPLHNTVLIFNCINTISHACFLNLSANYEFVQNKMRFFEVEYYVKLTYISKIKKKVVQKKVSKKFHCFTTKSEVLHFFLYLSRNSTYLWIVSKVKSSLISLSTQNAKYKLAYRL